MSLALLVALVARSLALVKGKRGRVREQRELTTRIFSKHDLYIQVANCLYQYYFVNTQLVSGRQTENERRAVVVAAAAAATCSCELIRAPLSMPRDP